MPTRSLVLPATLLATLLHAQYGTFDAGAVKAARSTKTVVVLDAGDSPYNRTITEAVKTHWTFTSALEFVTTAELATRPMAPDQTYLLKTRKVDPVKFEASFLTLVQGWKPKKGEVLAQTGNMFTSIPAERELAYIQLDVATINEKGGARMLDAYVKHLQDYLSLVEGGKITDKTTADRTYAMRNRLVRGSELWLAKEHLDKSVPDAATVKGSYTAPSQVKTLGDLQGALEKQDRGITITDVVITGGNKNKHCFKRIFNAGTGELMYLRDDAAIFGKKEGFLDEDLKTLERAR